MRSFEGFKRLSPALGLLLALAAGQAGAVLKDVGPTDPGTGFPSWYRDTSTTNAGFPAGLPLDLCLSQTPSPTTPPAPGVPVEMCVLLPLTPPEFNPALPIVGVNLPGTNFPAESFYMIADARILFPAAGARLTYRAAIEAGFATPAPNLGLPAVGQQVTFARVRIVVDPIAAGTYTVTHPYGVETITVTAADVTAAKPIRYVRDIGLGGAGFFGGALSGPVGPWLTWDVGAPIVIPATGEQFIGDPTIAHAVKGSPFGTNLVQIQAPGVDFGGGVGAAVSTNLFNLAGKIHTQVIRAPLVAKRATYGRDAANTYVDVFATADPLANVAGNVASSLQVSGAGIPATAMAGDGLGNFFAHVAVPNPPALPATLTITNVTDVPPSVVAVPLVDDVAISLASYDPPSQTLTVRAASKDRLAPPTLTYGATALTAGSVTATLVTTPPETVTVTSAAGGKDTRPVSVVPGPVTAVALTSNPPNAAGAASAVTFTGAASGGSGDYEYRFWVRSSTGVWKVAQDYTRLPTWTWASTGSAPGAYFVQVDARNAGSVAAREAAKSARYDLTNAAAAVTVAAVPASPAPVATTPTVTLTATGSGGAGTYQYQFWTLSAAAGSKWVLAQPYGSAAGGTFAWATAGLAPGTHFIQVDARSTGSTAAREAFKVLTYTLQ